ncbi:MAG: hypothetical protein R2714_02805 [Microthrixaceae bacterium]
MITTTPTSAGFDNGPRGRFNAWFFATFDRYIAHTSRRHKNEVFGNIEPGDIVETSSRRGRSQLRLSPSPDRV